MPHTETKYALFCLTCLQLLKQNWFRADLVLVWEAEHDVDVGNRKNDVLSFCSEMCVLTVTQICPTHIAMITTTGGAVTN